VNRAQRGAHARLWPVLALALIGIMSAATLATHHRAAPATAQTGSQR